MASPRGQQFIGCRIVRSRSTKPSCGWRCWRSPVGGGALSASSCCNRRISARLAVPTTLGEYVTTSEDPRDNILGRRQMRKGRQCAPGMSACLHKQTKGLLDARVCAFGACTNGTTPLVARSFDANPNAVVTYLTRIHVLVRSRGGPLCATTVCMTSPRGPPTLVTSWLRRNLRDQALAALPPLGSAVPSS